MSNPEYWVAYEAEEALGKLQETFQSWRIDVGLTSAEVAERMGVRTPTVSKMEKMPQKWVMGRYYATLELVG